MVVMHTVVCGRNQSQNIRGALASQGWGPDRHVRCCKRWDAIRCMQRSPVSDRLCWLLVGLEYLLGNVWTRWNPKEDVHSDEGRPAWRADEHV